MFEKEILTSIFNLLKKENLNNIQQGEIIDMQIPKNLGQYRKQCKRGFNIREEEGTSHSLWKGKGRVCIQKHVG